MVAFESLAFVFVAGLVTALATGVGALPFFVLDTISDRGNVVLCAERIRACGAVVQ